MFSKDGKDYFIFDSHLHFWDASPANWKPGAEEYAKGWIECFHAYQGLGPAETHWPLEKFQKYTLEDFEKDVFVDGGVDAAVFQSTYLKEWYTDGFNDADQNGALIERFPGKKLIINGRFDPREGTAGLEQLEADAKKYNMQGRQALHRRVVPGLARLEARATRSPSPSSRSASSSASRTSTSTRARRSGRWTRTRSTSPTSTTWPPTTTAS